MPNTRRAVPRTDHDASFSARWRAAARRGAAGLHLIPQASESPETNARHPRDAYRAALQPMGFPAVVYLASYPPPRRFCPICRSRLAHGTSIHT